MRAGWLSAVLIAMLPGLGLAQGATVPFGGMKHDATQPVEITSDRLELDQAAGSAVFTGTVKVGQGTLRLAADRVEVYYDNAPSAPAGEASAADKPSAGAATDAPAPAAVQTAASPTGKVRRMVAIGNVTLANGAEAAEAQQATYEVRGRNHRNARRRAAHPGAERALERNALDRSQQGHGTARGAREDDIRAGLDATCPRPMILAPTSGWPKAAPASRSPTSPRATRAGRCFATCR